MGFRWSLVKSSRPKIFDVPAVGGKGGREDFYPAAFPCPVVMSPQKTSSPYLVFSRSLRLKFKLAIFPLLMLLLLETGCMGSRVKRDFTAGRDFDPRNYSSLAVVNLDAQVQFSPYVEAELLKKGYQVKEGGLVAQLVKKEGLLRDGALDAQGLSRMGDSLQVKGIVLCKVLDFSRFRDSFRLSMKCVSPQTGDTLWYAEGSQEGKKGEKSSELLKKIVAASLAPLPRAPR